AKAWFRIFQLLGEPEHILGALDLSATLTSQRKSVVSKLQTVWKTRAYSRRLRPLSHNDFATTALKGLFIVISSSRKLPQRSYR
ncbi:hypothetical protein CDAR_173431, partial [Caerostris darwini]